MIRNDEELQPMFKKCVIMDGGVLPNIHAVFLCTTRADWWSVAEEDEQDEEDGEETTLREVFRNESCLEEYPEQVRGKPQTYLVKHVSTPPPPIDPSTPKDFVSGAKQFGETADELAARTADDCELSELLSFQNHLATLGSNDEEELEQMQRYVPPNERVRLKNGTSENVCNVCTTQRKRGQGGAGRHRYRMVLRDAINGIHNRSIMALAARGGALVLNPLVYDFTRWVLKVSPHHAPSPCV